MLTAKNKSGKVICARCGKEEMLTIDHFIPKCCKMLVNGNSNLVGLCRACNAKKANTIVLPSWYKYLSKEKQAVLIRYMRYCYGWIKNNTDDPEVLRFIETL